jgi:putative flavoprotein involved in K+ transport
MSNSTVNYDTIVIGGGQAGLSTGYYLQQQGHGFVILDANQRIGDAWRKRWESLRLFTPARFDGLPGMPFPAPANVFPTKDEMGDYLEAYAMHFKLPIRSGVRVDCLSRQGKRFVVTSGVQRFEAKQVIVAMSNWQSPRVPPFAQELDTNIIQLHSSEYMNPPQLREGGVLVVGAGNSGADIAMEVAKSHPTWLSGRDTGHIPFRIDGFVARILLRPLFRLFFHRVLTVNTPIGRKIRPKVISHGMPLIRVKPADLASAGIERVAKTVGVREGLPLLEDDHVLDVANVIWCTGFHPGFSWIDLPIFGEEGPNHERGIVATEPGLYFVGLQFLYAASSAQIHGVSRDAEYIVRSITARSL